jgi:hypothetical protein
MAPSTLTLEERILGHYQLTSALAFYDNPVVLEACPLEFLETLEVQGIEVLSDPKIETVWDEVADALFERHSQIKSIFVTPLQLYAFIDLWDKGLSRTPTCGGNLNWISGFYAASLGFAFNEATFDVLEIPEVFDLRVGAFSMPTIDTWNALLAYQHRNLRKVAHLITEIESDPDFEDETTFRDFIQEKFLELPRFVRYGNLYLSKTKQVLKPKGKFSEQANPVDLI